MPFLRLFLIGGGIVSCFYFLYICLYYYSFDDPISFYRVTNLETELEEKLYGQHIANEYAVKSLKTHFMLPVKATALVLYGDEGTGKSHFVKILKDTLYTPELVHTFTPEDIPNTANRIKRRSLLRKIDKIIENYPESLFIFEHVEKMSHNFLDDLYPYLDYTYFNRDNNLRKPVYIFIASKFTPDILMKKLYNDFYKSGNSRTSAKLEDFEEYIKKLMYNDQKCGFYGSALIQGNVIDHFIPFLPLEKDHVKNCIRDSFVSKGLEANEEHINEVLKHLEWAPEKEKLYAVRGCKGLNHKVIQVKNKYNLQKN